MLRLSSVVVALSVLGPRCGKDQEPPPPVAPVASATTAAPSPVASARAVPSCPEVRAQMGGARQAGFAPQDVPDRLTGQLETHGGAGERPPPAAVVTSDGVLFFEVGRRRGMLEVSRGEGAGRKAMPGLTLPKPPTGEISVRAVGAARVGDDVLVAILSGKEAFAVLTDARAGAVRRFVALDVRDPAELTSLDHVHVAASDDGFGIALRCDPVRSRENLVLVRVGRDGVVTDKRFARASIYIEPRVAWTGAAFAVLGGPPNDYGPHGLGAYFFGPSGPPTYAAWLPSSDSGPNVYPGGALRVAGAELHVGMEVLGGTSRRQVVHAPVSGEGPARVEVCDSRL